MKRLLPLLYILAFLAGVSYVAMVCPGCVVQPDPYYPPIPPDPVDPVDPIDPIPTDESWPPEDIATYGEDVWGQIEEGMTRAEVLELMPTYWKISVVEGKRSYVYITNEKHPNGFPKVFIVRYPKEPDDDTVKVVETLEQPY